MSINQYYAEYDYRTACQPQEKKISPVQNQRLLSGGLGLPAGFPERFSFKNGSDQADKAKPRPYTQKSS
ncbi:hypothetical protein FACS1894110_10270 [Spirochaetia bacterium]|nr:hypothetical protein FACS1894110_10270 [Spirochaetia bacterium]